MSKYSRSDLLKQIKLKDYITDIYISEFSTEWERNILDLIPHRDRRKHSALINLLLNEIKKTYIESMKDFILRSILSCNVYKEYIACKKSDLLFVSKQNIIEEDIRYDRAIFIKRRYLFAENYFLSYPIVRYVINTAHCILPAVICDFKHYYEVGMLSLNSFQDMVFKDIKRSALIINQFYIETFKAMQRSKVLKNIFTKRLPQFMQCFTNIFIQQILNVIMRSIDYIISVIKGACCCPQIEFQLVYENDHLVIKPNIQDVFSAYHNIIRSIENIAQDLMPLEKCLNIRVKVRYIKIVPPSWFIEMSHRNLQDMLEALFRPVNDHVALISAQFGNVYASNIENLVSSLISEQPNFEAYLARICEYNEYLSKTNSIMSNLYYDVGKLEQINARKSLQQICHNVVKVLTTELVKYHQNFNHSICTDFETLRTMALDIPKNVESLIQLSEYISRTELMKELEQKIYRSIYMLSRLLEITVLTDKHIDLNKTTVNWLHDIQPIFAQSNTLCEAMKNELEEDLQRRINMLNIKVDAMFPQLVILDNMDNVSRIGEYKEHYKDLIKKYGYMDNEMQSINSEEKLFKFPETDFPKITELKETIMPFYTLICTIHQWQRDNSVWLDGRFEWLTATVIERETMRYFEEITKISRMIKSRIKMDATTNKSYKFSGIADDPDPMQQPAPLKLCWQVLNDINEFKVYLPLVTCMCNSALKARHWIEMSTICNFDLAPNAGTTLRKMINMNLMENIDKYRSISLGANKELRLQRELAEMIEQWEPISFEISTDTESDMMIFRHVDTIEMLLGEHLIKLEEMRSSYFVKPILTDLTNFSIVLVRLQKYLNRWTHVQSRKICLERIFFFPRIVTRLKRETSLYLKATNMLRNIYKRFMENPTFQSFAKSIDLLQILNQANENLEKANRGVKNYLDIKRLSFTRFFFLEDSEIQGILFESIDTVKQHMLVKKCFAGIERLKFNKSNYIKYIIGHYGESLRLNNNIMISIDAECEEEWLIQLEKEMKDAVRQDIFRYYPSIDKNLTNVLANDFPSMVIICGLQLYWTASVERCLALLNIATLESLSAKYANWIVSLTNKLKNNLTQRHRSILISLIIIMSTHQEIIQLLLEKNIRQSDFEWIAQIRYYRLDEIVKVSVFDAIIMYGYEYNHYQQNIINTPLTDRCLRTIIQAYRYHLYSIIVGSTGVGKTEIVKNLTKALAKPFYVVNCGNDVSYKCVVQIFKGVISCGAWICFENFSQLRLELLSAIAQSLRQMQQTMSSNLRSVSFESCNLNFNISGNVCVNINPEQSRYVDLPDNLKVLFRIVTMMAPDIDKIAEIELFAGGFHHAKSLATKLAIGYKLLSEHLRERGHYHFDTSSLKTVVATAINMKRKLPDENEYVLLLRSMIAINIPRLHNTDVLNFQSIMQDCFPETVMLSFDCSTILKELESVCAKKSLILHQTFKLKVMQMAELMHVHRALILFGNPLNGKTEILHTLAEALSSLREQKSKVNAVILETVIPGVTSNDELFGYFCDESGTWKDGLCTAILRRFAEDTSTNYKWLVFDGALNVMWTENLYTALDEHETLYLMSGERLYVNKSISIIFETTSATNISPSMLSRCGIVYIDSRSIDWRSYIWSRVAKCEIYNGYNDLLYDLFDWAVDPHLNFLKENDDISVDQVLHRVTSMLNLFEMLLKNACENAVENKETNGHLIVWAQVALILAIVWGLGGNLIDDSQNRFNAFCTLFWNGTNMKYLKPNSIKHFEVTLPNEGLIQDNFYVFKGVGYWKSWDDSLKNEKIPDLCDNFDQICIPSISTIKYNYVFSKHIKHRKPFLLYGDVAIGKTCIVRNLLTNRLPEKCLSNFYSFTAMTTVARARKLLLSKLSRIRRARYGSKGKDQYCVNFVDDVSEATVRKPEAPSIFELLRQLLDYNYCYGGINELCKIFVQDTVFVLAITARKINGIVPLRLSRHFNTYAIPIPTINNIFRIYSNVLLAHLKKNLFSADVIGSVTSMINATIEVYTSVKNVLRPVPGKLYYSFDMRDISRVIDGCGLIHKESVETKIMFIRLWAHEILRVFGDRILDESDKEWLFVKIRDIIKNNFKDSFEVVFDHLPKFENNQITKNSFGDLMFGNFINNTEKSGKCKRYEEIVSIETLKNKVLDCLNEYNGSVKKKMNIIVSHYMLESLIKISRILNTPGGNMLMISTVGSGGKSTTILAAFMQQHNLYKITTESYYSRDAWRDNLRKALRECGALQKDVTYFINERQMKDMFLSDISCLLSTSELPDLYSIEDWQNIIEMTRLYAQGGDQNVELSARSIMTYFTNQCRNRLHFVLRFSPTNTTFKTYMCSYPNLRKHCTVNCYQEWPNQVLFEIAMKHMRQVGMQEEIQYHVAKACVRFHNDAKEMSLKYYEMFGKTIHVTSSAFLHMLNLYKRLTSKKQKEIITTRNRYIAGLEKLELAAEQVEQMKTTLTILKPQLELSAQQTMITMKEVENENVIVERATMFVKHEEEIANKKAEIASTLKTECEADLAVAIPILEDAVIALNTLKPTDITLVKAMKNPPDTVKLVMAAVCVMLGILPDRGIDSVTGKKFTDYWGPSKRILSDMNFLQNLKDYDKDDIAPAVMQVIKKTYMTDNSFMPHIVAKASSAAEGLCKWVRAMVSYDEIVKVVAPKKKKLAVAQIECNEVEAFLNEKRRTLAALNAKLAALHDSLRQALQKKLNLETEVATCIVKLIKAEKLIASLDGEKSHWMQCAKNLQMNYDSLEGNLLLSCGIVVYMASYNIAFRDEILTKWKKLMEIFKISYTKTYSFTSVLGAEIKINRWQLCGLSKNRFAMENAIILDNSEQWCLFIDPQNQINKWIRNIEKKNDLVIVKLTDLDYMSVVIRNIEKGIPILLENVEESFEVALDSILLKDIYENENWYIDIGNKSVKYSFNFRLYITTRLPNPNYAVDIYSKLTIIDFSMPNGTLRDKLLDIVISKEKPELQEQFEAFWIQDAANKKILQQQEENILSTLSSTTTNILEDEDTIRTLDFSKTLTMNIMKKQEAAKAIAEKINEFRDAYRQFADHCVDLFCTLNALSNLNHMYRFSFSWFIQLYVTAIETSSRSIILEKRLRFLKSSFTRILYSSVCRSLFEKHKLLYSFLLCIKILIDTGQVTREEVKYFISSSKNYDTTVAGPEWLPTRTWRQICKLSVALPDLREFASDFRFNSAAWEKYYNTVPFQSHSMPKPWADNLTRFQKLILIKVIRRDKVIVEVMRLIKDTMGEDVFESYPHLQISESYTESNCLTPIVFILPSYGSPLSLISAYASVRGYVSKFVSLSMGDGRQDDAEIYIEQARKEGGWIFLQNCHHVAHWLPRLEQICENLNGFGTSLDFRLWLSSCSTTDFPISILQRSVKIAYDYPLRLKQSLLNMYRSEPVKCKDFFEGCPGKDREFSKLLYGLCFFHGIVRAREHFGPRGWSTLYEFDHMDFEVSVKQLQNLINQTNYIPYDTLLYLIGECNYGGKIVDSRDRKCLQHLLKSFCNDNVINDSESFSDCMEHLIPQRYEYHDIIAHINNMQLDRESQVFNVDENALITWDATVAGEFLDSVFLLSRIELSSGRDNEVATWDQAMRMIEEIIDKLPALFNINEITSRHPLTSHEPLNAVLIREAELINEIVIVITNSLNNFRSTLNSDIIMIDFLEEFSKEIYNNQVPRAWITIDAGIATKTLSSYINLLLKRVNFVRNWHEYGLSHIVRFDVLSCCKRFLTGALLAFSRRRNISVERVILDLKVRNNSTIHNEEDTYYIHGLYLFGARWDARQHTLIESQVNVFWYDMPPIRLAFDISERIVEDIYECPVYISPIRSDEININERYNGTRNYYITNVLLETKVSHVHWIKRGTALFCQIDEFKS